jgi:hypothetical protein
MSFARDATTLSTLVEQFEREGFAGQFAARSEGQVACLTCHGVSDARDVTVSGLPRAEGASDPDDMLAVAAVTCPRCQAHGTLVLGFGPNASGEDADVLRRLADRA